PCLRGELFSLLLRVPRGESFSLLLRVSMVNPIVGAARGLVDVLRPSGRAPWPVSRFRGRGEISCRVGRNAPRMCSPLPAQWPPPILGAVQASPTRRNRGWRERWVSVRASPLSQEGTYDSSGAPCAFLVSVPWRRIGADASSRAAARRDRDTARPSARGSRCIRRDRRRPGWEGRARTIRG